MSFSEGVCRSRLTPAQMSKYCIYQDRPLCGLVSGEQDLSGGCVIFGVQHHCKGCPNCIEMGDEPYSISATANQSISARKNNGEDDGGRTHTHGTYRLVQFTRIMYTYLDQPLPVALPLSRTSSPQRYKKSYTLSALKSLTYALHF